MLDIANALVPIIFTILLGYAIKRSGKFTSDFWQGAESLTYYVLTPALLVSILSNRKLADLEWQSFLLILFATVLLCALLITLWQRCYRHLPGPAFTSLFQGGVRYNTFISLALVAALYGDEGLSYSALAATGMILLINILCVTTFSLTIRETKFSGVAVLKQLLINPWIQGAAIGITLNITGIGLHSTLSASLDLFGRAAFPIGLILVGAGLNFKGLKSAKELIITSVFVQFLVKPVTAIILINLFELEGIASLVILVFLSVPTAPASYILARKLGGDAPSMAAIITVQTVLAFITLPITLYWAPSLIGAS
ncbi:MAG: AEC family transporter [Oceanospirillaceae bacterium]